MKTRNFILFVLAAVVCGAFLCADSQAKVCFLGEECSYNVEWSKDDGVEDSLENACKNAGYGKTTCNKGELSYACPMKATYKKCCPSKYRYEACVYPTEVDVSSGDAYGDGDGKCGTRYTCRCPDEYKITSATASSNNCRPGGGYCLLNDGTTDAVKYKTCTCDRDIFTDENSCTNNQSEASSCKDDANKVYKKCYCDRSEGKYPYANCEHGKAAGAKTCVDSNTKRSYFSACKSAEDWCKDEGYKFTDCSGQRNCSTENKVTYTNEYGNKVTEYLKSDYCVLGAQCPKYAGLYKCSFDKASWCAKKGYDRSEPFKKSEGAGCKTLDGIPGTVVNCPANDGTASYYYKCKVKCDQRMLQKIGVSMTADTRFGSATDSQGKSWYNAYYVRLDAPKNGFKAGYHLFLRDDFRMLDNGLSYDTKESGDKVIYAAANSANKMYQSINGIGALYKLDPSEFSECKDEYGNINDNPKLTIPLSYGGGSARHIVSRDFNNIHIAFTRKDGAGTYKEWPGKTFDMEKDASYLPAKGRNVVTYVWNNIKMTQESYTGEVTCNGKIPYATALTNKRTVVDIKNRVKLRITGKVDFNFPVMTKSGCYYRDVPNNNYTIPQNMASFAFRGEGGLGSYKILEFSGASMNSNSNGNYPDVESYRTGEDLLFKIKNSTVYTNAIFSDVQMDVYNSTLTTRILDIVADTCLNDQTIISDTEDIVIESYHYEGNACQCRGISVRDSTVNVTDHLVNINGANKLYVFNSTFTSAKPIRLKDAGRSIVCMRGSSLIKALGAIYKPGELVNTFKNNMKSFKVGYVRNINSSTGYMYSKNDSTCLPYTVNESYNENSLWKKHCTGGAAESISKIDPHKGNVMYDQVSHYMPGEFEIRYAYFNSNIPLDLQYGLVKGWWPKGSKGVDTYRCKKISGNNGQGRELKTLAMCGESGNGNYHSDPKWTDDGFDTYMDKGSVNKEPKCVNRRFLCSGCAYCDYDGISHRDWTDIQGGF